MEQRKIFAKHVSAKGFICQMYKDSVNSRAKEKFSINKMIHGGLPWWSSG